MTNKTGFWIVGYGAFLVVAGIAGYLSNPEKAATALISGGTFGGLSVVWGLLMCRGIKGAGWAALVTTVLLSAVFSWRATVSWMAVAGGQPEKLVAAVLITLMGIASLAMLARLVCNVSCAGSVNRRRPDRRVVDDGDR